MYLLYSIDLLIIIMLYYLFVTRKERNHSAWIEVKRVFSSRLNFSAVFKRVAVFSTVMIIFKGLFMPFVFLPLHFTDFYFKHFNSNLLTTEERKIFGFLDFAFTLTPFHMPVHYGLIQYRKAYAPHFPQYAILKDSRKACQKSDFKDPLHCSQYIQSLVFSSYPEVKEKYYQEFLQNADKLWENTILYNYQNMPEKMCDEATFFINRYENIEDVITKVEYGCYELKCRIICWRLENHLEIPEISEEYKKY